MNRDEVEGIAATGPALAASALSSPTLTGLTPLGSLRALSGLSPLVTLPCAALSALASPEASCRASTFESRCLDTVHPHVRWLWEMVRLPVLQRRCNRHRQ